MGPAHGGVEFLEGSLSGIEKIAIFLDEEESLQKDLHCLEGVRSDQVPSKVQEKLGFGLWFVYCCKSPRPSSQIAGILVFSSDRTIKMHMYQGIGPAAVFSREGIILFQLVVDRIGWYKFTLKKGRGCDPKLDTTMIQRRIRPRLWFRFERPAAPVPRAAGAPRQRWHLPPPTNLHDPYAS